MRDGYGWNWSSEVCIIQPETDVTGYVKFSPSFSELDKLVGFIQRNKAVVTYVDNSDFIVSIERIADKDIRIKLVKEMAVGRDIEVILCGSYMTLRRLIQHSKIDNGKVIERCTIARYNGELMLIGDSDTEGLSAIASAAEYRNILRKKTSRFEVGKQYLSLNSDIVYLGNIKSWYSFSERIRERCGWNVYVKREDAESAGRMLFTSTERFLEVTGGRHSLRLYLQNVLKKVISEGKNSSPKYIYTCSSAPDLYSSMNPMTEGEFRIDVDTDENDMKAFVDGMSNFYCTMLDKDARRIENIGMDDINWMFATVSSDISDVNIRSLKYLDTEINKSIPKLILEGTMEGNEK